MNHITQVDQVQRLNQLFKSADGMSISKKGRLNEDLSSKSFVYGEVVLDQMMEILSRLELDPSESVFYDLGSGTGKAVILAAASGYFKKVVGIEFVKDLFDCSLQMKDSYLSLMGDSMTCDIHFYQGDMLKKDVSDATVVFAHSTCFEDDLVIQLKHRFQTLKPGTKLITVSKSFMMPTFRPLFSERIEFSWGQGNVYIQEKI